MSKPEQIYTRSSNAQYRPLPQISPYSRIDPKRYENPKAVFRHAARKLKTLTDPDRRYTLLDVGCANGEFLYYLHKEFPHWELHGRDIVPDFIEIARSHPGLQGVDFEVGDLFDINGTYDIVSFMGSVPIYHDVGKPLARLLELVVPGGYLLADGLFNMNDIEVQILFHDHSTATGEGKWRSDFNQHSRKAVATALQGLCQGHEFEDIEMDVAIERVPGAPQINVFTFRDASGRNVITNGANLILIGTMLTVQR